MDNQSPIKENLNEFNKNIDFNLVIIIVLITISVIVQIIDLVHHW